MTLVHSRRAELVPLRRPRRRPLLLRQPHPRRRLGDRVGLCRGDDGAGGDGGGVLLHLPDDHALHGAALLHDAAGGGHADARAHGRA